MNDQNKMMQFVGWLSENVPELKGQSPEQIVDTINKLSQSQEGQQMLQQLVQQFEQSAGMFKKGGKLDYLVCLKKGGKCGCKVKKSSGGSKVVKGRTDGVNGNYSKQVFDNGYTVEVLSRKGPNSTDYTERQISPQKDTVYYLYDSNTIPMDQMTLGNKYVTPTKYKKMNWLMKRLIGGVRPEVWDKKFDSYKCGGSINKKKKVNKAQDGLSDLGGYQRAANYHSKYSDAGTLRKIQMFLQGRGYYNGDLDGLYGQQTYNAIRAYQKDNGLTSDGMWGEDTNSIHRVLNAVNSPYRNDSSGRSGAHKGSEQGNFVVYNPSSKMTDQQLYRNINNLKEAFYADPESFWNDDKYSQWREFLYKTPEGNQVMNEFYDATPDEIKKNLSHRVMSTGMIQDEMDSGIRNATNRAADIGVKYVLPSIALPLSVAAAPVTTALGLAGAYVGGNLGRGIYDNLHTTTRDLSDQERAVYEAKYGVLAPQQVSRVDGGNRTSTYSSNFMPHGSVITDKTGTGQVTSSYLGSAAGGAVGAMLAQYATLPELPTGGYYRSNGNGPSLSWRSQNRAANGQFPSGRMGWTKDQDISLYPEHAISYNEGALSNPSYSLSFPRLKGMK